MFCAREYIFCSRSRVEIRVNTAEKPADRKLSSKFCDMPVQIVRTSGHINFPSGFPVYDYDRRRVHYKVSD